MLGLPPRNGGEAGLVKCLLFIVYENPPAPDTNVLPSMSRHPYIHSAPIIKFHPVYTSTHVTNYMRTQVLQLSW